MKHVRGMTIAWIAALSVGCVAHIDSSALSKTEADGGDSEQPAKPSKPAMKPASIDDDAGSPTVAQRDASKPPQSVDDDDAGTVGAAMPTAGSASPKPDAGAACDFRGIVSMKCGNAACHGAPGTSTGLDLTSPSLATRVDGRKGPAACATRLLIDKDNPTQSALYLKVTGTTCGSQMPLTGTPLTASEKACVLSWIEGL